MQHFSYTEKYIAKSLTLYTLHKVCNFSIIWQTINICQGHNILPKNC